MHFTSLPIFACVAFSAYGRSGQEARSLEDYINAIRKAAVLEGFERKTTDKESPMSLVELENLKKPLSVSQFSEWLHNLYYDEEKKRKSAIKYMLDNQFGKPQDSKSLELEQ